jgi:hypothetical protein
MPVIPTGDRVYPIRRSGFKARDWLDNSRRDGSEGEKSGRLNSEVKL